MTDLRVLKAAVDLRTIVNETHPVGRSGKIHCLWHDDACPSLHIYPDGYICYGCNSYGDPISWLRQVRGLSMGGAVAALKRYTGTAYLTQSSSRSPARRPTDQTPISERQLCAHRRRAARLERVPKALLSRGFTLADCRHLGVMDENGNAVFPIIGPAGEALALKRRYAIPKGGKRYDYVTPGHGTPAWCSPEISRAETIWVIEGELNGMACWLALETPLGEVGIMGMSGAVGALHTEVLRDKTVYVYADGDGAGEVARVRWANDAVNAGASAIRVLEPWKMDACEIAGTLGRGVLKAKLMRGAATARPFNAPGPSDALAGALKRIPSSSTKPLLVQSCSLPYGLPTFAAHSPNVLP